ncbi:Uncharacterised protein [Vibrio cholerae]|nr:Uncharacterised protein [Vibrio cholerae]
MDPSILVNPDLSSRYQAEFDPPSCWLYPPPTPQPEHYVGSLHCPYQCWCIFEYLPKRHDAPLTLWFGLSLWRVPWHYPPSVPV